MLTIRDGEGQELATALADTSPITREVVIQRVVHGKGHLMQHYFGRGLRAVLVDSGETQLHGILSTRWVGAERQWIVRLGQAATCCPASGNQIRNSPQIFDGVANAFTWLERAAASQAKETVQ